jgi:hypothetical protein
VADGTIAIEWLAAPNARGGGFVPLIRINGRTCGHRYLLHGLDLEAAELAAQELAADEAGRYIGDWTVTVVKAKDSAEVRHA